LVLNNATDVHQAVAIQEELQVAKMPLRQIAGVHCQAPPEWVTSCQGISLPKNQACHGLPSPHGGIAHGGQSIVKSRVSFLHTKHSAVE